MKRSGRDVEQIYDVIAFRVITESVRDCYGVLGVVHSNWTPVPGRFKDFIALPKPNLYQSLHTTVIGPRAERMEIQIRTQEMHRIAEQGIAAHWQVQGGGGQKTRSAEDGKAFAWLRQLMEWQRDLKDPTEFIETVKIDLFQDEVFVFTPKGDVKALPKGATPIDLAYSIHSAVGEHCSGARVNGLIVPLRYALRNGDTVEILTSANQKPSKDWLKFVVTSRAQTKIRHFIRMEQRERSRQLGRDLLGRELRKQSFSLATAEREGWLESAAERLRLGTADDLLVAVGYGKVNLAHAADAILIDQSRAGRRRAGGPVPEAPPAARRPPAKRSIAGVRVQGEADILVKFAKCCTPVAGRRDRRVHQPRSRRRHPHARLPEGAGPRSGPARRRLVGRGIQDAAPGRGSGHLHRPPGAAGRHLQDVHGAGREHLAGQVPDDRGRPRREHLPGHGRAPRAAQDGPPEPGFDRRRGVGHPAVIEGRAMASNTRITWKRRTRKHVNMGKKRKAKESRQLDAQRRRAVRRASARPRARRPTARP